MHDEAGGGALQRGLRVLVRPAAVPGHRAAVEQLGVAAGEAGIVDQHDHRLALHVDVPVVVPVPGRRVRAVAEEHHWRILQRDFRFRLQRLRHHVGAIGQLQWLAGRSDVQGDVGIQQQGGVGRHGLVPRAMVARLQAHPLELGHQEIGGALRADGAGLAPAERIGAERLVVAGEIRGVDRRCMRPVRFGGGRLQRQRDQAQHSQQDGTSHAHRNTPGNGIGRLCSARLRGCPCERPHATLCGNVRMQMQPHGTQPRRSASKSLIRLRPSCLAW